MTRKFCILKIANFVQKKRSCRSLMKTFGIQAEKPEWTSFKAKSGLWIWQFLADSKRWVLFIGAPQNKTRSIKLGSTPQKTLKMQIGRLTAVWVNYRPRLEGLFYAKLV